MIREVYDAAKKTFRTGVRKGLELSLIVGYLEFIWLIEGFGTALLFGAGGFLVFLGLVAVDF